MMKVLAGNADILCRLIFNKVCTIIVIYILLVLFPDVIVNSCKFIWKLRICLQNINEGQLSKPDPIAGGIHLGVGSAKYFIAQFKS
jgi:hypothetical protein